MTVAQRARRRRRRTRDGTAPAAGGHGRGLWVLLVAGAFLGLALLATAGGAAVYGNDKYQQFAEAVVPPEELLAELPRGGAHVYDRHGALLYEFIDEFGGLRRPVPLSGISPWLIEATVATEDANFWENNGLNIRGLTRAAIENLSPVSGSFLEGSGGSSITQQLAKNVYIPKEERAERSVERKLKEVVIAIELTDRYTKEQILEWYLNSISYGGIYVGIEAAAQGYFGKAAADLTLAESALLAGIPQSPARYNPLEAPAIAAARQNEVLDLMVRHDAITPQQATDARAEVLELRANRFEIDAPHFVLGRVAEEIEQRFGERALYEDGLEVTTTLDLTLQHRANEVLEQWITEFEETSDGHNGALYALDPHTGQILVYAASRDYFRDDIEGRNDNVISLNSPGSTLKPFTYMGAFMDGWSTGTGIIDAPAKVIDAATGEFFEPRNPSGDFQGVIPAAQALGNSLNIPAFKTILFAGVNDTVQLLKQMGLTTLDNPLGYGPALTLGGVDITLQDLTYAYSTLATGGIQRGQQALTPHDPGERNLNPVALLRVTDADGRVLYEFGEPEEQRKIGSNFAYLVTSVLSDGNNQCITFSCGALGLPGRPSAQKTGTSEPFEDSRAIGDTWAFGYTPDLVAGVWAGNSDNSPMVNIVSTSISWRAWRDFMTFAHEHLELPVSKFVRPSGVVERELCWPSGRLPTDLCPAYNRYSGLFAADAIPTDANDLAELQDSWWQEVSIDTRTGLLATPTTPSAFVSREVRLVLPPEEIEGWEGLREWALSAGLSTLLAPIEDSTTAGALLRVTAPVAAQTVSGTVTVLGRADSEQFQQYRVEWGRGTSPASWVTLWTATRPVSGGRLGSWDTTALPNGDYSLRVVLLDAERGALRFAVPVVVDNGEDAPSEDLAPFAELLQPAPGSVVRGNVRITGTAVAGDLADYRIEVGAGLAPAEWQMVYRADAPVPRGALATWNSTTVADGSYTLRLTVQDRVLGLSQVELVVTVQNEPDEE